MEVQGDVVLPCPCPAHTLSFVDTHRSCFYFLNFTQKSLLRSSLIPPFPGSLAKSPRSQGEIFRLWMKLSHFLPSTLPWLLTARRRKYTLSKYPSRPCCLAPPDLSYPIIKPQFPFLSCAPATAAFPGSSNAPRNLCTCLSPLRAMKHCFFKETFPQHTRPEQFPLSHSRLSSWTFQHNIHSTFIYICMWSTSISPTGPQAPQIWGLYRFCLSLYTQ